MHILFFLRVIRLMYYACTQMLYVLSQLSFGVCLYEHSFSQCLLPCLHLTLLAEMCVSPHAYVISPGNNSISDRSNLCGFILAYRTTTRVYRFFLAIQYISILHRTIIGPAHLSVLFLVQLLQQILTALHKYD